MGQIKNNDISEQATLWTGLQLRSSLIDQIVPRDVMGIPLDFYVIIPEDEKLGKLQNRKSW